jgi:hypothetical protein
MSPAHKFFPVKKAVPNLSARSRPPSRLALPCNPPPPPRPQHTPAALIFSSNRYPSTIGSSLPCLPSFLGGGATLTRGHLFSPVARPTGFGLGGGDGAPCRPWCVAGGTLPHCSSPTAVASESSPNLLPRLLFSPLICSSSPSSPPSSPS